jgi:phage shock protein PspC (stress-responsive transcriptional regulator)
MVSEASIPRRLERPRLRRRAERRLVAGVAGGIADSLNAPVAFVRVVVGLAIAWVPWMAWVYAAAALAVPAGGRNRPDWDNLVAVGRLAVLLGVPWVLLPNDISVTESLEGSPGNWIALYGIVGAGAVALLSADYRRGRPRSPGEARSAVLAALPLAVCAALFCAGVLLVDDVRWERYVALPVVACGVAVLAAPRRRELVAPAMVALGAAALIAGSGARLEGGVGDVRVTPAGTTGEPVVARRAAGIVTVDLRRLRAGGEPISLDASVGHGNLHVAVPNDSAVVLDAHVGAGRVVAYGPDGSPVQGFDMHLRRTYGRFRRDRPAGVPVRVVADVGVGEIHIAAGRDALSGFPEDP